MTTSIIWAAGYASSITQYSTELFTDLSIHLRKLVAKIESDADLPIDVEVSDQRTMACEPGKRTARILIPDTGPPRRASVFHELLNPKRYLADGAPKLVYCDDSHVLENEDNARTVCRS